MAAPQVGKTLVFTLTVGVSTQISTGGFPRRGFMITNNDLTNSVSVGFGTGNVVTAVMHIIPPGGVMNFGDFPIGDDPGRGASRTIGTDISATAVTGSPMVAFTEW